VIDNNFIHMVGIIFLAIIIIGDLIINRHSQKPLLWRLVLYSFLYYIMNVINLTIFPIDPYNFGFIVEPQLIPFYFIYESIHYGIQSVYVYNLIMLLPLGIYIPLLFPKRRNVIKTTLVGLFFSLIIEITQLIINRTFGAMRQFNVDDLILNTLGTALGFFIFCLLWRILTKYRVHTYLDRQC
jgi:glycopeptide antibiotics resistance protein